MRRQWLLTACLVVLVMGVSAGAAWFLRSRLAHPAGTPTAPTGTGPEGDGGLARKGRLVFGVYCASCHGADGHGDGPSAADLRPPPRDFGAGAWKYGTAPAAVRQAIADGIPGTAMPASRHALSAAELDAVTAHVLSLAPRPGNAAVPAAVRPLLRRAGLTSAAAALAAPDLELRDGTGKLSSVAALRGKVVLLVFWETGCLPCLRKLPQLERLAGEFAGAGLAVVPVCLDEGEPEGVREVGARHVKSLPLYVDARGLARLRYGVGAVPAACLIGRDGRVLGSGPGPDDWSGAAARELLRACLAPPGP